MPESGGPTTWSGIYFQNRVGAYFLAKMLWESTQQIAARLAIIQLEALQPVDDIVLEYSDGTRVYQAVKENIERKRVAGSPWAKLWNSFHNQTNEHDFKPGRDTIELVLPTRDTTGGALNELADRGRTSSSAEEFRSRLSQELKEVLDSIAAVLPASPSLDDEVLQLLKTFRVRFMGDSQWMHDQLMSLLFPLFPRPEHRVSTIDALLHLVLQSGRERRRITLEDVTHHLAIRGIPAPGFALRSFQLVSTITDPVDSADAQRFFRGFETTWSCVMAQVPVRRTCYESHKAPILTEATKLATSPGLKVTLIVGPRGVGKTTVAKQIALDLATAGHIAAWLPRPFRLRTQTSAEVRSLLASGHRVHLFAELWPSGREVALGTGEHILSELAEFVCTLGSAPRLSLYFAINSNHFETIRDEMDWLPAEPRIIRLPMNLDNRETQELVVKLRTWKALGSLGGRSDEDIFKIFHRKANRLLLVALVEATAGTNESDNFRAILRREYSSLPSHVKTAYAIAAMSHSFGTPIPYLLLSSAMTQLPGAAPLAIERFGADLKDVLLLRDQLVFTRHPLIARALCQALDEKTDAFWPQLIRVVLQAVNERNPSHISYLEEFAASRVVSLLGDTLDDFGRTLIDSEHSNLSPRSTALLANSVARTFQSRGNLGKAIFYASRSKSEIWSDPANSAEVVLGYSYLLSRNHQKAASLARSLATHVTNPWHLLHAIRLLCKSGHYKEAEKLFEAAREQIEVLPAFGRTKGELIRANVRFERISTDSSPWERARWVRRRLEMGQIEPYEAIEILMEVLAEEPNIHPAYTDCCHLLFLEKRYDEAISLADHVAESTMRHGHAKPGEGFPLHPIATRSMCLATKAWALFNRDGSAATTTVEELFRKSLDIMPDNAWAHNWRGVFLHITERESRIAEEELKRAISSNRNVPFFYRNAARIAIEVNLRPYSRATNRRARQYCETGLALCPPESYWNWGGLRAELESLKYCTDSLEAQGVADQAVLTEGLALEEDGEYLSVE